MIKGARISLVMVLFLLVPATLRASFQIFDDFKARTSIRTAMWIKPTSPFCSGVAEERATRLIRTASPGRGLPDKPSQHKRGPRKEWENERRNLQTDIIRCGRFLHNDGGR